MRPDPTEYLPGLQPTIPFKTMKNAQRALESLNPSAVRVLLLMSGYEMGGHGECRAKAATMAGKLDCSVRTIRRALASLKSAGLWERTDKRMRWSGRVLSDLGRLVVDIVFGRRHNVEAAETPNQIPTMTRQLSPHNGNVEHTPRRKRKERNQETCEPAKYQVPRGAVMTRRTWDALAEWLGTAQTCTWARCKVTYRAFNAMVSAIHRSREWRTFNRLRPMNPISPDALVRLAVQDAMGVGAGFGTVESAQRYIRVVVLACLEEHRLPGEPTNGYFENRVNR